MSSRHWTGLKRNEKGGLNRIMIRKYSSCDTCCFMLLTCLDTGKNRTINECWQKSIETRYIVSDHHHWLWWLCIVLSLNIVYRMQEVQGWEAVPAEESLVPPQVAGKLVRTGHQVQLSPSLVSCQFPRAAICILPDPEPTIVWYNIYFKKVFLKHLFIHEDLFSFKIINMFVSF